MKRAFLGLLMAAAITNPSQIKFTQNGTGAASRSLASKLSDVVSVKDFGAVGDGVTDDTAAINAAFTYLRTTAASWTAPNTEVFQMIWLVFPSGRYKVTSVNATGIRDYAWGILGYGAVVYGSGAGNVVFDMTHSRGGQVNGLTVVGDATTPPKIGVQVARASASDTCDTLSFYDVTVYGQFTQAVFMNEQCEDMSLIHPRLTNNKNTAGAMGLVADGLNHWNITSAYQTITLPVDTGGSFNNMWVAKADIRLQYGPAIWISRSDGVRFEGSYAAVVGSGTEAIHVWNDSHNNPGLRLDVHVEQSPSVTTCIKLVGPNATPLLQGFLFRDHAPQCTAQIVDATGVTVKFENSEIDIPNLGAVPTNGIFNPKANVIYTGKVYVGSAVNQTALGQQGGWIVTDNRDNAAYGPGSYYITDTNTTEGAFKGTFRFFDAAGTSVAAGALGATGKVTINNPAGSIGISAAAVTAAPITFLDQGTAKFQIGKQTDNSWFMYDAANTHDFLDYTPGATGTLTLPSTSVLSLAATKNNGTCTLNGASPAVCTATVLSGARCVAVPNGTTAAAALHTLATSVTTTTLTVTGANGLTDAVTYHCF